MAMSPDTVCRMSSEQIATALDRLQRELATLQADLQALQAERDRRVSARQTPRKYGKV